MKPTPTKWDAAERRLAQFDAFLRDSRRRSSVRYRRQRPHGNLTISALLEMLEE